MEIGFKNPICFTMNSCIKIWNKGLVASYKNIEFVITYAATCISGQERDCYVGVNRSLPAEGRNTCTFQQIDIAVW